MRTGKQVVALAVCFINGCDYIDIDPRGPVVVRHGDDQPATWHYACTEHWEAIIGIVGRQHSPDQHRWKPSDDDAQAKEGL